LFIIVAPLTSGFFKQLVTAANFQFANGSHDSVGTPPGLVATYSGDSFTGG